MDGLTQSRHLYVHAILRCAIPVLFAPREEPSHISKSFATSASFVCSKKISTVQWRIPQTFHCHVGALCHVFSAFCVVCNGHGGSYPKCSRFLLVASLALKCGLAIAAAAPAVVPVAVPSCWLFI